LKNYLPGRWLVDSSNTAAYGGFTTTALPNEAYGFSLPDFKSDIIYRFHITHFTAENTSRYREVHLKIVNLKEGFIC